MPPLRQLASVVLAASLIATPAARAETGATLPVALRGVNPRLLSGGLYSTLDAAGAFGGQPIQLRARAGATDLSKGKPPAVLDARVGPNTRLGVDPTALGTQTSQAEPHIFRSAANPDTLLATFQEGRFATGGGSVDCGYALSRDGGLTWTRALIPQLTTASGGVYQRATDPVAAIGPQGDLYLATLVSLDNAFGTAALAVSRSTDNGATWAAPAIVFQQTTAQAAPDKDWLAVNDFSGTANSGRLVATWTNFTADARGNDTGNNLLAAVSDDRGATWSAPIAITPTGTFNQGSQPLFLPDGSLVVVYITFANATTETAFSIDCKRSTDGGRTFPTAATRAVANVAGWSDPDLRSGIFLPSATVARTTGDLFITYTALVAGSPRVLVVRSTDKGATWSAPVIASDNPHNASVDNPAIAVTPDGQSVSVVFMDKRNSPAAADGHFYFLDHYAAFSLDAGATWQPNVKLTELPSDIRYAPLTSEGYMLGDYLAIAPPLANDQACIAIWCDTRTGDSDPFSVRFVPAVEASSTTWARAFVITSTGDFDGDGLDSSAEFALATDPRRPDYGDEIVAYRLPDNTLAVASAERPGVPANTSPAANTVLSFADTGTAFLGATATLTATEFPSTPPRAGLVWAGKKFSVPTNRPLRVQRGQAVVRGTIDNPVFQILLPLTNGTFLQTDARLINLSTRGQVGTGANQLIVGFVTDGDTSALVRAAGPALTALGLAGALVDPRLVITNNLGLGSSANDNWQQSNVTADSFASVGAFPFASGSLDAALLVQTAHAAGSPPTRPQAFTAIVSGANGGTGLALAEIYDAPFSPGAPANPRLLNLSTRGQVGAGDNALIAGFVVRGAQPRRVLVRAIGPSLASFGLGGLLADPQLALFHNGTQIATNDDWEISRSSAAITVTAQRVGAFALNAASLDAALLITLAPGSYTVVVTGVNGATGLALVEVYDAD